MVAGFSTSSELELSGLEGRLPASLEMKLLELELLEIELLLQSSPKYFWNSLRSFHITKLSFSFISIAFAYKSGWAFSSLRRKLTVKRFLPFRSDFHTFSKLPWLQMFWVIAIVKSRFSTPCHQLPGTNMVSPGC